MAQTPAQTLTSYCKLPNINNQVGGAAVSGHLSCREIVQRVLYLYFTLVRGSFTVQSTAYEQFPKIVPQQGFQNSTAGVLFFFLANV